MFCVKCGAPVSDTAKFCPFCGSKLPERAPVAEEPAPVVDEPVVPVVEEPAPVVEEVVPVVEEPAFEAPVVEEPAFEAPVFEAPVVEEPAFEAPVFEAPVVEEPVPPAPPEAPARPRRATPGVANRIFSVLLSILLFAALAGASAVTVVRSTFTRENLSAWVSDLQLTALTLPVGPKGESVPVIDYLTDLCADYEETKDFTREDIEEILELDFVKKFMDSALNEYASYFLEGNTKAGFTAEDIVNIIKENEKDIKKVIQKTGYTGDLVFDYEQIEDEIDRNLGDSLKVESLVSVSADDAGMVEVLRTLQTTVSLPVMIASWGVCVLLLALLIVLNRTYITSLLAYAGVPGTAAGLLYGLPSLLAVLVFSLAAPFGLDKTSVIYKAGELAVYPFLIAGAVMAGVGILLLVVRRILVAVRRRRAAKAAQQFPAAV